MPAKPEAKRVVGHQTGGTRGFVPERPERPIDVTGSYTFQEVAAYLQISKRAVVRLVDAGKIGYLEVNQKNRRILGRQILDYMDRQARGPRR
jgi:excisionase family DNA binding protein